MASLKLSETRVSELVSRIERELVCHGRHTSSYGCMQSAAVGWSSFGRGVNPLKKHFTVQGWTGAPRFVSDLLLQEIWQRSDKASCSPIVSEGKLNDLQRRIFDIVWNGDLYHTEKILEMRRMLWKFSLAEMRTFYRRLGAYDEYTFLRVGPLFFLDAGYRSALSQSLRDELESHLIWVEDMPHSTIGGNGSLKYFTISTLAAMLNTELQEYQPLVAAAGDGILGLTALHLGASKAVLIEKNPVALARLARNLVHNDLGNERAIVIQGDLKHRRKIRRLLPPASNYFLLSNIGPWKADYRDMNNGRVLDLIPYLENVAGTHFQGALLAGYNRQMGRIEDTGDLAAAARLNLRCHWERGLYGETEAYLFCRGTPTSSKRAPIIAALPTPSSISSVEALQEIG